ncbi:Subtilisin-like protease SBT5.6 [Linum perenne]
MTSNYIFSLFISISVLLLMSILLATSDQPQKNYIVYFGEHTGRRTADQILETHHSYLSSVKETDEEAKASLIYSYKHTINGFAASLTPWEASQLNELEEVVSVIESRPYKTHTTRSWEFAGLNEAAAYNPSLLAPRFGAGKDASINEDLLHRAGYGKSVIVGVLDSGIWPEARSFNDEGMEPIPETWKGICQTGQEFNSSHCNNSRLAIHGPARVEARSFIEGWQTRNCISRFEKFGKYLLHAFVWILWGERNNRIFRDLASDVHKLAWRIALAIGRWVTANGDATSDEFGNWMRVWHLPKIIGARYYVKGFERHFGELNATEDYRSPRDKDGHGTHVSSIAVGRQVGNASAFGGFAYGTASGGAPLARLAVYKVCWPFPGQEKAMGNVCSQEDMLAAMDDAIADGVHVISISIGSDDLLKHTDDAISIGAFHALKKDVVVACSAGNSGPTPASLSNPAPWIITVGASSVDRAFLGSVVLGNGKVITGQTVTPYKLPKRLPLIYASDATYPWVKPNETNQCLPNSLSPEKVKGKIVLCIRGTLFRVMKGMEVKRAGGAGFILGNSAEFGDGVYLEPHVLPTTALSYKDTLEVINYLNSTKNNSTATLVEPQTVFGFGPAPLMAEFTSRGPNIVHPSVLKPDITAPGLNILAAWSEASPPSKISEDRRVVKYNFDSGTSMSCPHVAGLAALVKAIHPTWSTATIRSAIMTTATVKNNKGEAISNQSGDKATPFEYGSGHFRPSKAADPGLVYDASYIDYLLYLCSYGVKNADARFKCPESSPPTHDLNYPSVSVSKLNGTVTVKRTVTNHGGGGKAVYLFGAKAPAGLSVKARPSVLEFGGIGERKSFELTIRVRNLTKAKAGLKDGFGFGWFSWRDDYHVVRSPIVISLA